MTVAEAGKQEGLLLEVIGGGGDRDRQPGDLFGRTGRINADLTVGVDVAATMPLIAN